MTSFSGNGGAASYSYDGNGLRVIKTSGSGTSTVSIYSGSSVIAEYDSGAASTAPSREYIYNSAGGATTGLLAMISSGTTTYYHQDHLSVRLTTSGSGTVLTQQGSFPFGEKWYQSGSANKWAFTSYQRDTESGYDYALARYYNSRTGTFCSADPLAGDPSDPQSWNRYPYGRNDPVDVTDPSGKSWLGALENLFKGMLIAADPVIGIPFVIGTDVMQSIGDGSGPPSPRGFGGMSPLGVSWNGTPWGSSGGLTNGIQTALGLLTMADVGGPIMNATKENDVISAALQAPNLIDCGHSFFGPNFRFTRSNMPHIDATQNLGGATAGRTIESMVPATGRATVLIDKGTFAMNANDPFLRDTYLHEAVNATAIQQFTNQQTAAVFVHPTRRLRAELGPRGSRPSDSQRREFDRDIGQQFEHCLHGGSYK